jgi:hypothetical protein
MPTFIKNKKAAGKAASKEREYGVFYNNLIR